MTPHLKPTRALGPAPRLRCCLATAIAALLAATGLLAQAPTWVDLAGEPGSNADVTAVEPSPADAASALFCVSVEAPTGGLGLEVRRVGEAQALLTVPSTDGSVLTGFAVRPLGGDTLLYAYTETAAGQTSGRLVVATQYGTIAEQAATATTGYFGQDLVLLAGSSDVVVVGQRTERLASGALELAPFLTRRRRDGSEVWSRSTLPVQGFLTPEAVHQALQAGDELHVCDADVAKILRVDLATGDFVGATDNPYDDTGFLFGRTLLTHRDDTTWALTATVFELQTYFLADGQVVAYDTEPTQVNDVFLDVYRVERRDDELDLYGGLGRLVNRVIEDPRISSASRSQVTVGDFRLDDRRLVAARTALTTAGELLLGGAQVDPATSELDAYLGVLDFDNRTAPTLYEAPDAAAAGRAVTVRAFAFDDGGAAAVQARDGVTYLRRLDANGMLVADRPLELPAPDSRVVDAERFGNGNYLLLLREDTPSGIELAVSVYAADGELLETDALGAFDSYYTPQGRALAATDAGDVWVLTTTGLDALAETALALYAPDGSQLDDYIYDAVDGIGEVNAVAPLPGGGFALAGSTGLLGLDTTFLQGFDADGRALWREALAENQGSFPVPETLSAVDGGGLLLATTNRFGQHITVRADGSDLASYFTAALPDDAEFVGVSADEAIYVSSAPVLDGDLNSSGSLLTKVLIAGGALAATQTTTLVGAEVTGFGESSTGYVLAGIQTRGIGTRALVARYDGSLSQLVDVSARERLRVWPNPARGTVFVAGLRGQARYELLDVRGHVVRRGQLRGGRLEVGALPAGAYVLRAADPTGASHTTRLVIY